MVETTKGLMLVPQEEEAGTRLGTDEGSRTLTSAAQGDTQLNSQLGQSSTEGPSGLVAFR